MVSKSSASIYLIVLVLFAVLVFVPSPVRAGGWVVITLDHAPENLTAGEPYRVSFMARQHGRTPWRVEEILIEARQPKSGEAVTFTALPEGEPGHYQAELVFPAAGQWEWSIQSGMFPDRQPMPALAVSTAESPAGSLPSGSASNATTLLAGLSASNAWLAGSALLALAAGAAFLLRGRANSAYRLVGIGLFLLCGGLVFAFFSSVDVEAGQATAQATALEINPETGRQVFLAKGCVVCHINAQAVKGSETYSINYGPDLTTYRNDPAYLKKFLADPAQVKPTTDMPNLGLSTAEIDALVVFLNEE